MAVIHRRSIRSPISVGVVLATADDLNGVQDLTLSYDITGAGRVFVVSTIGTPGTAGIDVVAISKDGGKTWASDGTTGLLGSANDSTGTVLVDGQLEAAGVEPITANAAVAKFGPYEGPTAIRVFRYATDMANSIAWQTGAPAVYLYTVGLTAGSPTALA